MRKRLSTTMAAIALLAGVPAGAGAKKERAEGYAEWRRGEVVIVDGQSVRVAKGTRLRLPPDIDSFTSLPLGYEVKAHGPRGADGVIDAKALEAKPNGAALFEEDAKAATGEMEAAWLSIGRAFERRGDGRIVMMGRLRSSGADVERVRAVVENLVPPYLSPDDFRVYVLDNEEWNAFACANGMICVHSRLLEDMDDDELAIILGHEIAHTTHEHTRRQFKKSMWIKAAALGVAAAVDAADSRKAKIATGLVGGAGVLAWKNGYGRSCEDQADRVGLRYAYEAGYDIRKGPALWRRFAKKYREGGKTANFFFADHSLASVRAKNLEREIAVNYRDDPDLQSRP